MGEALRVCIFTQQFGSLWSGVGSYATDLVHELGRLGCDVTVVSPPSAVLPAGSYRHVPVRPCRLDPTPGGWLSLSRAYRSVLHRAGIDVSHFDVLHFADAREALCLPPELPPAVGTIHDCYAAMADRNPLAYTRAYADGFRRFAYYRLARSLEARAYRRLDGLLVNSAYVADAVARAFGLRKKDLLVVAPGVGPQEVIRKPPPLLQGDPSILFVGCNFFRKGLPNLVRAVALLARGELPHVALHVIGRDRNRAAIERLVRLLGISERVHFHGRLDRASTRALYGRAEITCVPSLVEAFGLVYLESMAAGTPVVAGNEGGTVEFIRDGESGLLVDPRSADEIARALGRIQTDSDLRLRLVRGGKSTVARNGVEEMARRTLAVYESLVRRRRDQRPRSRRTPTSSPPVSSAPGRVSRRPLGPADRTHTRPGADTAPT